MAIYSSVGDPPDSAAGPPIVELIKRVVAQVPLAFRVGVDQPMIVEPPLDAAVDGVEGSLAVFISDLLQVEDVIPDASAESNVPFRVSPAPSETHV